MLKNIKIFLILLVFLLVVSGCGTVLIKDVKTQYDNWDIEIVELVDDIETAGSGAGYTHITAKYGYRLLELIVEITNATNSPRMIDLMSFKVKADNKYYRPVYIRHWANPKVSKRPELSAKENISRKIAYAIPEHSQVMAIQLPNGDSIKIDHIKDTVKILKQSSGTPPVNLIPMYGYPNIEKSAAQKKSDEKFIKSVVANSGTREKASKVFAAEGWKYRNKGDNANAMKRFNQSWLLNPNYYLPYWGFGALLWAQKNIDEAIVYYNKALSLIDDNGEKPRLLTDAARAYSILGSRTTDKTKSDESFEKANALFSEAIMLDPEYVNAYQAWAFSFYGQGNYKKAWEMVKKSRSLDHDINPKFINALSRKMPEPK